MGMEEEEEEEGKAGVGTSPMVSSSIAAAPSEPSSSSNPLKEKRRMFSVELKPGHTTIVSWKNLLKGSNTNNVSRGGPAAAAVRACKRQFAKPLPPLKNKLQVGHLEGELQDAQPSNHFSGVVEKIERLYMGYQSSDEEAYDYIPKDYQYVTEDSFIDDDEFDEYFQVDKLSAKHKGYFVNREKLEGMEASSSPGLVLKKRKRQDSTEVDNKTKSGQAKRDDGTMGNKWIKAATRSAPLIGKDLVSPVRIQSVNGEHYQEGNFLKNKINTSRRNSRPVNFTTNVENTSSGRISKVVSSQSFESNRHKGILPSRDPTNKSRQINVSVDPAQLESQVRAVGSQVESRSRKSFNCENAAKISTKVRQKEAYGTDGFPRMDSTVDKYPMQAAQPSFTQLKGGSTGRPKCTAIESAIHDLEKIVALSIPQKLDIQKVDSSSQGVKRRLPQDVKQRLAKVARLSVRDEEIIKRKRLASAARVQEINRQQRSQSTNSTSPTKTVITTNRPHISKYQDKARLSGSSTGIVSHAKKMMKRNLGVIHDYPAKIVL